MRRPPRLSSLGYGVGDRYPVLRLKLAARYHRWVMPSEVDGALPIETVEQDPSPAPSGTSGQALPAPSTLLRTGFGEGEAEVLRDESSRRGWFRLEYAILGGLFLLFAGYIVAYFVFGADLDSLKDWGYLGIFFIAMAGSATIVLPTPSSVAIFGGGVVLDPVLGIPAPLLVGLVAGLGDAIGEFSGYGLGFAGTDFIRNQRMYTVFEGWMTRRGAVTIFLLSTFPNPFFDVAGAAAGAARMPPLRFFLATLCGKIVKDLFLAYGGSFSAGLVGL